ncbi:MAG: hypothetical protein KC495_04855 [Dehalococcoidia bacterium]|nr:hypothetical protein [Dehalococcoidia bacterium]
MMLSFLVLVGLLAYLGLRPHQSWLLWLTAAIAGLGTDGIVRCHPAWHDRRAGASLLYFGLPALAVFGSGLFIHEALNGYSRPLAAIPPSLAIGLIAHAEYQTVDFTARRYGALRLGLAVAAYLSAFALYSMLMRPEVDVLFSAAAIMLVSGVLTLELLRENRLFGEGAILLAIAVGLSIAELRLVLYFFPLDSLLGGALLVIGFYLATGLVHHVLDHDLEWNTAAEYGVVAVAAAAAVIVTRLLV